MNRQQRRQAAKDFQAQLKTGGVVDLAEHANRTRTIFMGYVTTDSVRSAFMRSLLAVAARGRDLGYTIRPRDVELDEAAPRSRAYNLLLRTFLDGEEDHLLLVDTNIAFAPEDVAMLLASDASIAGALYFTAATGIEPWPTALVEGEDGAYVPLTLPEPPEDFDEENAEHVAAWAAKLSEPIPVASVGLGFALISRAAAQAVGEFYKFPFEYEEDRGADLVFGLRAAEVGHPSVLIPAARVGHLKVGLL